MSIAGVGYCFHVSFIISRHFNSREQQDYLCVSLAQSQARFKIVPSPVSVSLPGSEAHSLESGVRSPQSVVRSPESVVPAQTHFVDTRVWTEVSSGVCPLAVALPTSRRCYNVGGVASDVGRWVVISGRCEHFECYKMPARERRPRHCYCDFWQWIRNAERLRSRFRPRSSRFAVLSFDKWLRWCFLLPRPIWLNCVSAQCCLQHCYIYTMYIHMRIYIRDCAYVNFNLHWGYFVHYIPHTERIPAP